MIVLTKKINLRNQKVLIVDDVMTSGNTIRTCIDLLKSANPKKIDYLVLAAKKENIKEGTKLIEGGLKNERNRKKIL